MNMKRSFLVAIFVGLLGTSSAGAVSKVTLGLKGGLAISTFAGDNGYFSLVYPPLELYSLHKSDSRSTVAAGLFAEFPLTGRLALQPEVLYLVKGPKAWAGAPAEVRLRYFEFPLLLKLKFLAGPRSRVFVLGGPALALKQSSKFVADTERPGHENEFDLRNVKSREGTVHLGLGGDFKLGRGMVVLEGRYIRSLTGIATASTWDGQDFHSEFLEFTQGSDNVNSSFLFMIGYSFAV